MYLFLACDADVMGDLDLYLLARKGACVTVNMPSLRNFGISQIISLPLPQPILFLILISPPNYTFFNIPSP